MECPIDLRKLYTLIQFNIQKRYEQLLEFFKIHNFRNEIQMVEAKLNVIKHPMSIPTIGTSEKRKRTRHITTVTVDDHEKEISQSSEKHLKCN